MGRRRREDAGQPRGDWYAPLRDARSLGSTLARPGSLGGLHAARTQHLGQFFTPHAVAALLWRLVCPAIDAAVERDPRARVALFDNSVGTGRLFQFADPDRHTLAGCDVHGPTIDALIGAAEAAGFQVDLAKTGMQGVQPRNYGVGLLNPPFSIHLETPLLTPYEGVTCFGAFGPDTSAISHAYALAQALHACDVVAAVLPRTYAETLEDHPLFRPRLVGIVSLPAGAFRAEGTDVATSIAVFGPAGAGTGKVCRINLATLDDPLPVLPLRCRNTYEAAPQLGLRAIAAGSPVITLHVTGDRTVRIAHDGRKVRLSFACGLVQAKVMNALLVRRLDAKRPDDGRYPAGIRYKGQGWFDLELYVAQADPWAVWRALKNSIQAAGGQPVADPGIEGYLRRRLRRLERERVPLRHMVRSDLPGAASGALRAHPKRPVQCDPDRWGSSVLLPCHELPVTLEGSTCRVSHPESGEVAIFEETAFAEAFEVVNAGGEAPSGDHDGWRTVAEGRLQAFPQQAVQWRQRLDRVGAGRIASWGFQLDDLVELKMARGGVLGWTMGLGKTRGAMGLCLVGGQHNLIVVEAHLIDELLEQVLEVGLPRDDWQVITRPEQCEALRRINIISYSRLRRPICEGAGRRTYASRLRRRIHTLVCDEAHLLRNGDTQQTAAVWQISPKCRYPMTGTPVANYVRDLLPLLQYAGGDGTAGQVFGRFRPYLEPGLLKSMTRAARGVDVFRERHCVTEWVTAEFCETIRTGAKREVPKTKGLASLQQWAAPWIKRRVQTEPEVATYVRSPTFEHVHHTLTWDQQHLAHWLRIADHFAEWYKDMRRRDGASGKQTNLVSLLARINAVLMAGNYPQHGNRAFGAYGPLTSKQRALVDRVAELTEEGHKTIVYVGNPGMAEQIVRELSRRDIEGVPFHGKMPIVERTRLLNSRFRRGPAPALIATLGVAQTGLNLYQADRALLGVRDWTPKTEMQALYRLLRPQQTRHVVWETFELPGSLDTYQGMMVDFKADATGAAVDFLTPAMTETPFLHIDTIIERFVADLAERRGLSTHELRWELQHVA